VRTPDAPHGHTRSPVPALARALGAPVVRKDLREGAGTWYVAAAIAAYAILTAGAALIGFRLATPGGDRIAWLGAGASAYIALLALDGTVPVVLAARSLARERQDGTLDLLLVTAMPARAIVRGKALSAVMSVVLPSAAALPVLALTAAAGGIPFAVVTVGALILALTTAVGATLGALIGSASRSRARATTVALFATCAILTSAPVAVTLSLGAARALSDGVPAGLETRSLGLWVAAGGILACTHPFAAAVTTAAIWQGQGTLGAFAVSLGEGTIALPSPWMPYVVFAGILCAALVVAGAAVLDARRG
jgi:ABC-type transport system involved in cytochrome c biogenesis permease component